jgi:hypothetical protein
MFGIEQTIRENAIDPRARAGESDWFENRDVTTSVYLGLNPVIGIEWFLHRNISFHSEYYTLITAGWRIVTEDYAREYSNGDWYRSDSDLSGVYYSVRGYARAGVSFYFK